MFGRLRSEQGVTLIELVIAVALLGLVVSVVYSIQHYGMVSFSRGETLALRQQNVRTISRTLSDEIRFARQVEVSNTIPESPSTSDIYFWAIDGDVIKMSNNLQETLVKGSRDTSYSLKFDTNGEGEPFEMIKITVGVASSQGDFELETSVLGLNLQAGDISGLPSGSVIGIVN